MSRAALAVVIAAAIGTIAAPAFAAHAPARLEVDPSAEGAAPYVDGTWRVSAQDVLVELRRMETPDRRRFIAERTRLEGDPFAPSDAQGDRTMTFHLRVENRSAGEVVFDAQRCRLLAGRREIRRPLDMASLHAAFSLLDRDMPSEYDALRPVLLDGTIFLAPKATLEGLLVFPAPTARGPAVRVQVEMTRSDGSTVSLLAAYRRERGRSRRATP